MTNTNNKFKKLILIFTKKVNCINLKKKQNA